MRLTRCRASTAHDGDEPHPTRGRHIETEQHDTDQSGGTSVTAARLRLAALVVVVGGASLAVALSGGLSREGVQSFVDGAGPWGPVVYVLAYAVLTVAFFPGSVVTVVGGVVFGAVFGTFLTVIGATIGATAAFLLGRRLGRSSVEALAGDRVATVDDWLTRRGFVAVLYTRLLPILPFNALNYIAGVTGVRTRDYVLGTVIGIVPGTFAYSSLGGNLDDVTSPQFLGSVALVLVLLVSGPFLARRIGPEDAPDPDDD